MSNNNSVLGLPIATQKGMLAGTPRASAMQSMQNNSQLQAQANNALAGGRHRKRKAYGGSQAITVQQFTMPYEPQGGPGTNPNNQIQGISQTSTQMAANSALDSGATKMGGSRRRRSRKGGNPDWLWGCMSGGKKSRTRKAYRKHTKRNRKHRKSHKHRKH
jgi:hypothetical protein